MKSHINCLFRILVRPTVKLSIVRNGVWCISNLCRGKNPPPNFAVVSRLLYLFCISFLL